MIVGKDQWSGAARPAPTLPEGCAFSGEFRMVRAAARYGIRPGEIDEIDPGEMAVMLVVDDVLRAEMVEMVRCVAGAGAGVGVGRR